MHITTWRPFAAAVLLATTVASCTRPEENIGLAVQPEEDLLGVNQTDTVSMIAYTKLLDSLRTDELSHTLLGAFEDPIFGQSTASMFTQLRLSANDVDFGDPNKIVIDSLVLALKIEGNSTGVRTSQAFQILKLTNNFIWTHPTILIEPF